MSQNLEKFGVVAVWIDTQFQRGVKAYNTALKKADADTKKSTDSMAKSWQLGGDAIDKMVSDYVGGGQKVAQTSRKLGDDAKKGAKGFSLAFTEIRSVIMLGVGAIRTFGRVAAGVFNAAREGAQQLGQQRSFAIVSGGAEQAAKNLEAMRAATRGTATDAELMAQAVNILALGLAEDETQLFQVTRNVTQLGRTFKNFGAERSLLSFQLLASDLERSRARLDDFGLTMADVKPRMDELVASGLSLQEATRTALLEAMDEQMQRLGLTTVTTADSFGQATATVGNLTDSFKQSLAPGLSLIADAFVTAVTESDDLDEAWSKLEQTAIKLGATISAIAAGIREGPQLELAPGEGAEASFEQFLFNLGQNTELVATVQDTYNDALETGTQRMNEAADVADDLGTGMGRVADETGDAAEGMKAFEDAISKSRTQALEAFLQRAIQTERQLEDAAIARARKIEDIERQAAARRAQIAVQLAQTIAGLQAQAQEQRRTNAIALARQLEQIERNFQERKRAINQQFAVSFARAVRSRDALALVEAFRTRDRELEEARQQRNEERSEATANAVQQEQEQQRSLERQIEAARAAAAQQLVDAQATEAAQLEALRLAEERKAEDRALASERWLEDQARAFENRRVRALAQYRQDEQIYLQHLQRMLQLTNTFLPAIYRTGTGGAPSGPGRRPGRGRGRMAAGGVIVANTATDVTFGEAGPEMAIFQPLSQITNVNPASPQVVGAMRHQIAGDIQASMAGFEGRLTAEVQRAVLDAFGRVLQ